ncbi:MAG TPA: TIR domain-containing protein, partial [Gemmatimonadales bacterium]|nr:TIR domain-containing protein [Gemmatimonadales bacterium]
MPRILVNYRRDDSAAYAGRLADRLREHFGRENVFVDIDTIRPGEDFVDRIDQSIAACDVLVAVIGKSWLTAVDPQGRRRLDREDDFVRMEIAKALERHIRVIPALVGDAGLPEATQLPQDLVALSRRQAIEISDSRFHHDVDLLIEALSDTPGLSPQPAQLRQPLRETGGQVAGSPLPWRWVLGGALAIAGLALVGWFVLWRDMPSGESTTAGDASSGSPSESVPAATSASPTPAAGQSVGSGEPGASLQAPTIAAAPAGKTGIQIVWRGASSVPCYLFDETGMKALSPEFIVQAWHCSPDMGLWD